MGRLLATLATILILVLGAAFVVPAFMDWNSYRSDIEQAASSILGRSIEIKGDIDIALLPEPHFHAAKIVMPGGEAGGTPLVTADAVDLSLSLQALFDGKLEAGKFKLVHPSLALDASKPRAQKNLGEPLLPVSADAKGIEIEDGQIFAGPSERGGSGAPFLTKVEGTVIPDFSSGAYRFSGRFSHENHPYSTKFSAVLTGGKSVKLNGTLTDPASKVVVQADGLLNLAASPVFEGAMTASLPRSAVEGTGVPVDIELKSAARIGLSNAVLDDLQLTLDPQNRPQVLLGSANIGFDAHTANLVLQAQSLDAGTLVSAPAGDAPPLDAPSVQAWGAFKAAADRLLWSHPDLAVTLSLQANQVQLRGEPIEDVAIHGTRKAQHWVFEQMQANLPGESSIRLAGNLTKTDGVSEFFAAGSLGGKNLGRLSRWISPSASAAKRATAEPFSIQGSLTLARDVTAFEGVTGSLNGTAFSGNLRADAPSHKFELTLTGDNFDLGAFDSGLDGATPLSLDNLKAAWLSAQSQLDAIEGGPQDFQSASIDFSAKHLETGQGEAQDVALRVKFDKDSIAITKLSAGLPSGLTVHGEGIVPFHGAGQGSFDGGIEARTPQAILELAALTGLDASWFDGRRAEALAPAAIAVSYKAGTDTPSATARISGNIGSLRLDGHAQLQGPLSGWRTSPLAAQIGVSAVDGSKIVGVLFPDAAQGPSAGLSPGTLSIRLNGNPGRFETSGSLKTGMLQIQLDGSAGAQAGPVSFNGKISASSQEPDQFLPAPLLALLGGEPQAAFNAEANLTARPSLFDADALTVVTPKNRVTGRLAVDASGGLTRIKADLTAVKASLPSLLSYFQTTVDLPSPVPASLTTQEPASAANIWGARPFSLSAFQNTTAEISLAAKSLNLSDAFVLTDTQLNAKLEKGRLDIRRLEGKALNGGLVASLNLEAKDNAVHAGVNLTLTGADLSLLPNPGTSPVVTGKATVALSASGQGLSPRGIVATLSGRGSLSLSGGQLTKLSLPAIQESADELLSGQQPLNEAAVTKKVLEASQSSDFPFRRLKIPLDVHDGTLEIRRASFRGREGTVRMEGYLDLANMQADTTWQLGVSSGGRSKWPPVKINAAGPLRGLGAQPRTLSAEDFVRTVLVRKMEGDIAQLEKLGKQPAVLQQPWSATQVPGPGTAGQSKSNEPEKVHAAQPNAALAPAGGAVPDTSGSAEFEARIRDALKNSQASAGAH